jgi:hypothetical protein
MVKRVGSHRSADVAAACARARGWNSQATFSADAPRERADDGPATTSTSGVGHRRAESGSFESQQNSLTIRSQQIPFHRACKHGVHSSAGTQVC